VVFAQSSGAVIYIPKCAGCHGTDGIVVSEYSKGRGAKDASDPYIKALTVQQMFASVRNGKGNMLRGYNAKLTDAQIREAVAFYRELGAAVPNSPVRGGDVAPAVSAAGAPVAQSPAPAASRSVQGSDQPQPDPAQGAKQAALSGIYIHLLPDYRKDARGGVLDDVPLQRFPNGWFNGPHGPLQFGHFTVTGDTVSLINIEGDVSTFRISEDTFYDGDGRAVWGQKQPLPAAQVDAPPPASAPSTSLKLPSTYVNAQVPADQLQLAADNSFSLQAWR